MYAESSSGIAKVFIFEDEDWVSDNNLDKIGERDIGAKQSLKVAIDPIGNHIAVGSNNTGTKIFEIDAINM